RHPLSDDGAHLVRVAEERQLVELLPSLLRDTGTAHVGAGLSQHYDGHRQVREPGLDLGAPGRRGGDVGAHRASRESMKSPAWLGWRAVPVSTPQLLRPPLAAAMRPSPSGLVAAASASSLVGPASSSGSSADSADGALGALSGLGSGSGAVLRVRRAGAFLAGFSAGSSASGAALAGASLVGGQ